MILENHKEIQKMNGIRRGDLVANYIMIDEQSNIEGRILTFNIQAYDSNTLVSKMTHKRCVVNKEKFMSKVK